MATCSALLGENEVFLKCIYLDRLPSTRKFRSIKEHYHMRQINSVNMYYWSRVGELQEKGGPV